MMTRSRMRRLLINEPIQEPEFMSQLPDPIIQHAMSFLNYKEAARMSILSRRFASAWTSFPIIFFDDMLNMGSCLEVRGKERLSRFLSYVGDFLSRRPPKINLEKFSLCFFLESIIDQTYDDVENAISYALENNVKGLELDVFGKVFNNFRAHYNLPMKVLSAQSIIVLSLRGFILEPPQNFTSNLPSIKELKLEKCLGMETLNISSQTLKILVIEFCQAMEKIQIDASNLESFSFTGGFFSSCSINISAGKSLKYLYLKNAKITDQWIKHDVAQFGRLEVLRVASCPLLENFNVSNTNLQTVELCDCSYLQKIEIFSRSLKTFVYSGKLIPQVFIDSSSFVAKLSLSVDKQLPNDWFSSLCEFLSSFDHCKELEITCKNEMAFIVPIEFRDNLLPPLYDLKYLKLVEKFPAKSEELVDLVESLLWFAPHLTTLSIVLGRKEKSLTFEYHTELDIEEDLECCYSMPIKCWRHSLKTVMMENFRDLDQNKNMETLFRQNAVRLEAITLREDNSFAGALSEEVVAAQGLDMISIRNIGELGQL